MANNRLRTYQVDGPSGREAGTQTLTAKARTKGRGTNGVSVRCSAEANGGLCGWMRARFREIAERVESETSDQRRKRARRKAKA